MGIYEQGQLIATGSYQGKIIKCLAVCKNYQSENLLTSIITHLVERLRAVDQNHLFVYTKPENQAIFHSLGFQEILTTQTISFMELGRLPSTNMKHICEVEKRRAKPKCNRDECQSFYQKGHQYLIETAAAESEQVYVFVLSEERSEFFCKRSIGNGENGGCPFKKCGGVDDQRVSRIVCRISCLFSKRACAIRTCSATGYL